MRAQPSLRLIEEQLDDEAGSGLNAKCNGVGLTEFTCDTGPLGKRYWLDDAGALMKETPAPLASGSALSLEVATLNDLKRLIENLLPNRALCFGTMKNGRHDAQVTTLAMLQDRPGAIARTREFFEFRSDMPGFLLLDFDADHVERPVAGLDDAIARLATAVPELADASLLYRPSSSSFILNSKTGEYLSELKGQHIIIPVASAADIPRAGAALFSRLWLAGFGRFEISKNGSLLKRSIIDDCVFLPERLIFAARPRCEPPLQQKTPEPRIKGDPTARFDSSIIRDLSSEEQRQLAKIEAELRAHVEPEAKRKREIYIESEAEKLCASNGGDKDKALATIRAAVEQDTLTPDFVLHSPEGKQVTVAQILASPAAWHGRRFADPLEPEYRNDDRIAWLNATTGGRISLFSHAHGGRRYYLQPERTRIRLHSGELSGATSQVLDVLRERGELYEYGDQTIVRVLGGRLLAINPTYLQDYLGLLCLFERYDARAKRWLPRDVPQKIAEFIFERHGGRNFPKIDATISAPIVRPDGSLLDKPGYDAESRLFYDSAEPSQLCIPAIPSIKEAQIALDFLWGPYRKFEFVDDIAHGVMLAAILTAVLRPALPTAPAFGFDAPSIGSGKTLLASTLAALAGIPFDPKAPPDSDEEMRKYLFSCLRAGARLICLDNLTQPIDGRRSPALCAFMTAANFSDRILGRSQVVAVPNRALLALTGNNLRTDADLVRRILITRIDSRSETPYKRRFEFNPERQIRNDRIRYVRAALTLVRAAIVHGDTFDAMGLGPTLPGTTGSYEAWDTLVRQTIGWINQALKGHVGFGDPTAGISDAVLIDPHKENLRRVLRGWSNCFGSRPLTASAAWQWARTRENFENDSNRHELATALDALGEGDPRFTALRLSRWLAQHKGEIVDGLRFEQKHNRATKTNEWRVAAMS